MGSHGTRAALEPRPVAWPIVLAASFAFILVLHLPLLNLPYFWDEAGYYIPAARDLFLYTDSSLHAIERTSSACNGVPGRSLEDRGIFRGNHANCDVARGCFFYYRFVSFGGDGVEPGHCVGDHFVHRSYPVFFVQSSLAQVDLTAAGLTFWGLARIRAKKRALDGDLDDAGGSDKRNCNPCSSRTAGMEFLWDNLSKTCPQCDFWKRAGRAALSSTAVSHVQPSGLVRVSLPRDRILARESGIFSLQRSVDTESNPVRPRFRPSALANIRLPAVMAADGCDGNCDVPTSTKRRSGVSRPRIAISLQAVLPRHHGCSHPFHVGGWRSGSRALHVAGSAACYPDRGFHPSRRVRLWIAVLAVVMLSFATALYWPPPYGFSLEDNLAYREYIVMHRNAARFLQSHHPESRILTAWPASDEITRPYLGYVERPLQAVRIEDFSVDQVMSASDLRRSYDVALVFSTKYQPVHPLFARWQAWQDLKTRYFGYHRDLPPQAIAQILRRQP